MPKPDISATRSNHAREASALSAILTTADVDRRPGWFNPKEHVKKDHIYFEEDTSDEESTEHDDETDIDDVCHTSCEVCFQPLFVFVVPNLTHLSVASLRLTSFASRHVPFVQVVQ